MLKQDKEKYTVPKSVHDYIPITAIWGDGIFKVGNKFAKTFRFTDINYLVAGKEDNLVLVLPQIHRLIHATDEITIGKYLRLLNLDKAQITKLNKYRELARNNPITV